MSGAGGLADENRNQFRFISAADAGSTAWNGWHRSNETSKRLDEIPGVGPSLATALVASVADPRANRCDA